MPDINNVEDVKAMIAMYQSYTRVFACMSLIMLILLVIMWKKFAISYAFASVTGIAARSAIRKYSEGDTRTKYKNFIMIQEVMSAAELPKELKVL